MTDTDPMLDAQFMRQALELARMAEVRGEVPVGALIVDESGIVGSGWNQPIGSHDPTAHAEIVALREVARRRGNYRLRGCTLYVTLEPCPMCAGAMVHARIDRLVFGASDPRAGAAGTVFDLLQTSELNHRVAVSGGVLADDCRDLLQAFFRSRR